MMNKIQEYQKKCWANYKTKIKLLKNYNYLYGNPIKVHVPIDVAQNGVMIIGAYPTAHFNTINGVRDVPVEDHLYPFSNEKYFDGSRIRSVESGKELEEYYLSKLGISRKDCWITDLVKVFLFKKGHIKKYEELGYKNQIETRSQFKKFAENSIDNIHKEIKLAQPKVILTLGSEVASVLLKTSLENAKKKMNFKPIEFDSKGTIYKLYALPHPGIIMRKSKIAEKWREVLSKQIEKIKNDLS